MSAGRAEGGDAAAAIVAVGNELLFGETVDTNSAWLGRTLTSWGFRVIRGAMVPDETLAIQAAIRAAASEADFVVVTGGLGPTDDDLTKGAVAELAGVGLVVDVDVRDRIRRRFRGAGQERPPRLIEGQAQVPDGAVALRNDVGTAPGILLELEGTLLLLVPGVPAEMRSIVEGPVREVLEERRLVGQRVRHRMIHTTGIPESRLAELLEPAWADVSDELRRGVGLAYLPDELGVDLRLTVRGLGAEAARHRLDALEAAIDPVVRTWRYVSASGDLAEAVVDVLRRTGRTLATAESCTGGLVAERVTSHAGASDAFVGGIVSYSNAVKVKQLGVSEADLERVGAVSEEVARAMASGARERLGTDTAIAITGIAGPGGGSSDKPVGTVWIAIDVEGAVESVRIRFPGDRGSVRRRSAQAALFLLYRSLAGA